MMPLALSWRPRWAIGFATSQSERRSFDFEHPFDFDAGVERQFRDADGGTGMAPLVAQGLDHQVRGAVHDGSEAGEGRDRIDEAAEANAANDAVEVADRGPELSQHIDGAEARCLLARFRRDLGAELALVRSASLPSSPRQSWPEMMTRLPVRTNGT